MIFLIEYNRGLGRLVKLLTFDDSERGAADAKRLEVELALNRNKTEHEVVLLEAENIGALRRTHRRYFESLDEITQSAA
jgi:hypothetical protein